MTENKTSRQMIPAKTKAGGVNASSGSSTASKTVRRASANASAPKASQYAVTISRNMLPDPGAIGLISRHNTVIAGDCQSPSTLLVMSSKTYFAS